MKYGLAFKIVCLLSFYEKWILHRCLYLIYLLLVKYEVAFKIVRRFKGWLFLILLNDRYWKIIKKYYCRQVPGIRNHSSSAGGAGQHQKIQNSLHQGADLQTGEGVCQGELHQQTQEMWASQRTQPAREHNQGKYWKNEVLPALAIKVVGLTMLFKIFWSYLNSFVSGLVSEPAHERQAAEDDLAVWRPGAGSLCSPGCSSQWRLPPPRPLSSHWSVPASVPASTLPRVSSSSQSSPQPPFSPQSHC